MHSLGTCFLSYGRGSCSMDYSVERCGLWSEPRDCMRSALQFRIACTSIHHARQQIAKTPTRQTAIPSPRICLCAHAICFVSSAYAADSFFCQPRNICKALFRSTSHVPGRDHTRSLLPYSMSPCNACTYSPRRLRQFDKCGTFAQAAARAPISCTSCRQSLPTEHTFASSPPCAPDSIAWSSTDLFR